MPENWSTANGAKIDSLTQPLYPPTAAFSYLNTLVLSGEPTTSLVPTASRPLQGAGTVPVATDPATGTGVARTDALEQWAEGMVQNELATVRRELAELKQFLKRQAQAPRNQGTPAHQPPVHQQSQQPPAYATAPGYVQTNAQPAQWSPQFPAVSHPMQQNNHQLQQQQSPTATPFPEAVQAHARYAVNNTVETAGSAIPDQPQSPSPPASTQLNQFHLCSLTAQIAMKGSHEGPIGLLAALSPAIWRNFAVIRATPPDRW